MSDQPNGSAYTVKELVLQVAQDVRGLDGKLDGYIAAHEARHSADSQYVMNAASEPDATPAGRALLREVIELKEASKRHETMLTRIQGALALLGLVGVGTLVTVVGRVVGLVP